MTDSKLLEENCILRGCLTNILLTLPDCFMGTEEDFKPEWDYIRNVKRFIHNTMAKLETLENPDFTIRKDADGNIVKTYPDAPVLIETGTPLNGWK